MQAPTSSIRMEVRRVDHRTATLPDMAPNPESAAAAVVTLRAELDIVNGALESIDRKAALVPATLGVIAGLFVAPDTTFTTAQQGFLVVALATGIFAVIFALRVLWAQYLKAGPNAQMTVSGVHLQPADFNRAVAGSLAGAIDELSRITKTKGRRLNISITFAAITVLMLALARLAGGIR